MKKAITFERKQFINAMAERISAGTSPGKRETIRSLGPIYKQMDGYEKALADVRTHGPRYWAICRILANRFNVDDQKVLEVGCNTGFLSFFLKQHFPKLTVTAVDQADLQIKINALLAELLALDVEFVTSRAESLKDRFHQTRFDVVLLCELLEHLEYQSDAQREILRNSSYVCAEDGIVLVSVPFEDRIPYEGHLTEFNREKLESLLTPFLTDLQWLEAERNIYGLQAHFLIVGRPRR